MAVQLTEGAIAMLSSGKWQPADVKPMLQVIELRAVPSQTSSAVSGGEKQERYRIMLSDGLFFQQAMVVAQLNELVRSQQMQKGSVVQLKEYVCNFIRERPIFIIIDLDVIIGTCDLIGDAKSYPPTSNYPSPINSYPLPMYPNRGPTAKNKVTPRIIFIPIAALNPCQGRWTIKARVTSKQELIRYNNAKGDGKVFSFDLLDSDGGEIRVTCFNAVADQFYDQIEIGKVYYISKGSVKPASKAFNHLKNNHEILLDNTSTIQPCFDDGSIPRQQFQRVLLGDW
ncbi:unnamed protein product [Lactuca virosa]|uniref:Uncharacterized protein n=1 Tax=Lactuca virosa TaxID=75947 RepID=A0AAU9LKT4_9ASTR|nr:unnamed protein product [Lactuca virosa]